MINIDRRASCRHTIEDMIEDVHRICCIFRSFTRSIRTRPLDRSRGVGVLHATAAVDREIMRRKLATPTDANQEEYSVRIGCGEIKLPKTLSLVLFHRKRHFCFCDFG
jgi:hypothetical protein